MGGGTNIFNRRHKPIDLFSPICARLGSRFGSPLDEWPQHEGVMMEEGVRVNERTLFQLG